MKRNPPPDLYSSSAVGRRVQVFREGLGKTQREMSEKYGSEGDGQMWSHYETGRTLFPIEIAVPLALEYGLDLGWIYLARMDLITTPLAEIIAKGEAKAASGKRKGPKRKSKR